MDDLSKQATMPPPPTIPYGLCECGCGVKTPLIERNRFTQGLIKGTPRRFLVGHQKRQARAASEQVVIDGTLYRTIPLTKGKSAIVDSSDFEHLARFHWYAAPNSTNTCFYAARDETRDGKKITVFMHQELIGAREGFEIDHQDGDGLHNWRMNLRQATHLQNLWNMRKPKTNKSGFKGVHFSRQAQKWHGKFKMYGKTIFVGSFDDPASAGVAVANKARELRGEFART